jgi:uncharacterized membrane protein YccC
MASAESPGLARTNVPEERAPFWVRESRHIRQGLKTGIAGLIAYAIYMSFHLPEGYWAVFTALVVTQANLGASWKAALYRTAGSTAGAFAAALVTPVIGMGPVRTGLILFGLSALFAFLTTIHPSFSAAGFTAALVLLLGSQIQPWHLAWLRVLYTVLGAVIAFLVGVLVWPLRARDHLRTEIADFLESSGRLYRTITDANEREGCGDEQFGQLREAVLHGWSRVSDALDEARSEPSFSRFNDAPYAAAVQELDHLRQRLLSMCHDTDLYSHAAVVRTLVPELKVLTDETARALAGLAASVRDGRSEFDVSGLNEAEQTLDRRLQQLRDARVTSPFSLDRMLPFWSFLFNLKEIAGSLRLVKESLGKLS